jgi:hypothetical protein
VTCVAIAHGFRTQRSKGKKECEERKKKKSSISGLPELELEQRDLGCECCNKQQHKTTLQERERESARADENKGKTNRLAVASSIESSSDDEREEKRLR